jgi:hypothetical protein
MEGGRKYLSQITQYAEEQGNHQMLLFPMFRIQQKLEK